MQFNSISDIIENALCTGCGACAGICQVNAIQMIENTAGYICAKITPEKCIHCKKCLKVCPSNPDNSYSEDIESLRHGFVINAYAGYAIDKRIRSASQSGGVVTALLCWLLDQKNIDGAIVTNLNEKTARPESLLASTKEDIIDACGSYYSQSSVVKTILENKDKETAAVVLGCQAESLHHIRQHFPNITLPKYTIGLICAGENSGYMIDDLIHQCGYDIEDKDRFKYKFGFRFRSKNENGWPGDISLSASNRTYSLPKERRHAVKKVYEAHRCIPCFDKMNAFCDLVCGDPWGIADKSKPEGYTVIISRTQKGEQLLIDAKKAGVIALEPLDVHSILNGQKIETDARKQFYLAKQIFAEKNWMYPYIFSDDNQEFDLSVLLSDKSSIENRLEYTRSVNFEENIQEYFKKIDARKKELHGTFLSRSIQYGKQAACFILRKSGLRK